MAMARRAEAEGQPGVAVQMYRHIGDLYPSLREGFEARDALARLTGPDLTAQARANPRLAAAMPPGAQQRRSAARRGVPRETLRREPSSAGGYRIGRVVAAMFTSMGWLLLAGGFAAGIAVAVALTVGSVPRGLRELAANQLPLAVAGAVGSIFLGLFAIFAGQAARAVFDAADGARVLLAQARNETGHGP